ncbi:cupin-like domain-containing protein [Archangium violaceum]|uniref:cupin-like domain-containing protein n=1 Tax=Archangium violaceum TaxID=83451 RepID=UPI0019518072|nr:cupin-like domain-containing protein [Archangium violaceum]QRN95001.1 cupin-like domain-containing protein [Archangium violaceum]
MSLPPLPFTPVPVPRLERPTLDELLPRLHAEPVILTGLLDNCRLLTELRARPSLEQKLGLLQGYFRDTPIEFDALPPRSGGHYLPSYDGDTSPNAVSTVSDVPFETFAHRVKAAESSGEFVYVRNQVLTPESPLRNAIQFDFLRFAPPQDVRSKVWIGSNGQIFNLHYDDFINFICMFEGTKRVTMFSPERLSSLYHGPFDFMNSGAPASFVQLLRPDLARFPKFREALEDARVAVLEPGDVLLIPPLWWHHVESFGLNVMVNNWILSVPLRTTVEMWKDITRSLRLLSRATREQRDAARAFFARTVFEPAAPDAASGQLPSELQEQARRTRELVRTLPPFWRAYLARMYDHFIFQVNGDPFPTEPGALEALLARHEKNVTLYPNATLIDPLIP